MILLLACAPGPIRIVGEGFPGTWLYNLTDENLVELTWTSDHDGKHALERASDFAIEPFAQVRIGIPDEAELLEVRSEEDVWEFVEFDAIVVQ